MARTAIYFDAGTVTHAANRPSELMANDRFFSSEPNPRAEELSQAPVEDWIDNLRLTRCIAKGAWGAVFTCADARYCVKVPLSVAVPSLPARLKALRPASRLRRWQFMLECRNAELILEPPEARALRHTKRPGAPLCSITPSQHAQLVSAVRRFRAHPGYAHLHQILHFDARLPALVSARADGTVRDIMTRTPERLDWDLWATIARHVGSALQFIEERAPIVHLDIKPENVFFHVSRHAHFCLGDYGICAPKAQSLMEPERMNGSGLYNPPMSKRRAWQDATARCQSAYQFFAMMLDLIRFKDGFATAPASLGDASTVEERALGRLKQLLGKRNHDENALGCLVEAFGVAPAAVPDVLFGRFLPLFFKQTPATDG